MLIGGLQKSSLVDYPSKICTVVFTIGCNFRCGYCHNPELIKKEDCISENDFFEFIKSRQGKIDAIVISGGEPTLQEDLEDFIVKCRKLNFLIKLDTNGTNPEVLKNLLSKNLLDYIAMDIKAPFEKYPNITRRFLDIEKIKKSIEIIMTSGIDYEFRTTVVRSQLNVEDLITISENIKGAKKYYLQKFNPKEVLDEKLKNEKTYSDTEFYEIARMLEKNIEKVGVR
ncbi:anaerobic ribonucleoside-triphosphate reductase activating protein [bacterium]|nr:anaerobic ribonucleoside-triphosphate reductase activating protein [bacterium]